jgi:ABC-type branched-subunit amino acid transport system permease subunit
MRPRLLVALLAIAAVAVAPLWFGGYGLTLLDYIAIFALATLGLVVMTGAGGITSFGQAAFVGIGAYATAGWTTAMAGSPFTGLAIGLAASGLTAAVLGAATLRLGGHFLPLSTIAWGIAIDYLFGNIEALGSHNGIAAIPAISLGGISLITTKAFYFAVWPLLGLAMLLCANLLDSREGRAIRALRGGNALVESLGIDPFTTRLRAFVLAALLAALSGWLYAHFQRVVSATAFDLEAGIEFLLMALIGGAGHVGGAVAGAAIVSFLKEAMQSFLPLFTANSAQLEAVVLGAVFILILQRARWGLLPLLLRLLPRGVPPAVAAACDRWSLQALRRPDRRERCQPRIAGRRDPRIDRAERRRQEHLVQPGHRPRGAELRTHLVPRSGHGGAFGPKARPARHGEDLPAREAASRHDAPRQCGARRPWAGPRRLPKMRLAARPGRGAWGARRGRPAAGARRPRPQAA